MKALWSGASLTPTVEDVVLFFATALDAFDCQARLSASLSLESGRHGGLN
jgi:hypothetical protein